MKKLNQNLFSPTPSVAKKVTAVMLCMILSGLFLVAGCKKDNSVTSYEPEEDEFCGYVNMENIDKTIPVINVFFESLSDDLNDEQQLQALVTWLKSFSCIIDATVLCQSCNGTSPSMSEIAISFDENGITKDFILAISMSNPLQAVGYHYVMREDEIFYYLSGEKKYLQHVTNEIFLRFAIDVTLEQILAIIDSDASLQPTSNIYLGDIHQTAVIESKDGNPISAASIVYLKTKLETVSVTQVLQAKVGSKLKIGIIDEFIVLLKPTTSYTQLQELAEKNNCIVGEESEFVKNRFMVYLPKTSHLNVLLMTHLFYETGLFEYADPNFATLNPNIKFH